MTINLKLVFRVFLPLTGISLLIFIFSSADSPDPSNLSVESMGGHFEATREPRIGEARMASVLSQGQALIINATSIRSGNLITDSLPIALELDDPKGEIELLDGDTIWFSGDFGETDELGDSIWLRGSVEVWTSNGYTANMDTVRSNLNSTYLEGFGNIEGFGPIGTVTSKKLEIYQDSKQGDAYILKFLEEVFVTYWPED